MSSLAESTPYLSESRNQFEKSTFEQVLEITKPLELNSEMQSKISKNLVRDLNYGLGPTDEERRQTTLPMIKTFFTEIPDGSESGLYLGVDLGGTNFRIIMAQLDGDEQNFITEVEAIPQELYSQSCRRLYAFMASRLAHFLEVRGLKKESFKLGYTFSFPAIQEGMRCARLVTWTKGFTCPDGVGEDVCKIFQEAIDSRGDLDIELVCVTNDTTATLLAGAFQDHDCAIGVILATGCNAAYYEELNRMPWFLESNYRTAANAPSRMIINTEWGAFGDNGSLDFMKTSFDERVDRNSLHPGSFTFEKMFSGLYYGEVCRVVLEVLAERGLFLRAPGGGVHRMPKPWQMKTVDLSAVNSDPGDGVYPNTFAAMRKMGLLAFCIEEDLRVVHHVCRLVTMRAADIVSAACAALVHHIGRPEITVAFDGSFYQHLPGLSALIENKIVTLCSENKVRVIVVSDGSGRGGALAAAIAERSLKRELSDAVDDIVALTLSAE